VAKAKPIFACFIFYAKACVQSIETRQINFWNCNLEKAVFKWGNFWIFIAILLKTCNTLAELFFMSQNKILCVRYCSKTCNNVKPIQIRMFVVIVVITVYLVKAWDPELHFYFYKQLFEKKYIFTLSMPKSITKSITKHKFFFHRHLNCFKFLFTHCRKFQFIVQTFKTFIKTSHFQAKYFKLFADIKSV